MFAFLLVALVAASTAQRPWDCDSSSYLGPSHATVPCLVVPSCDRGLPKTVYIDRLSNNSAEFPAPTAVDICFTEDYLHLQYFAKADTYLKNTYTQCNSETYNQEVMEVFIAPFSNDSVRYHEFEITPFNVMYQSLIINPYLNGSDLEHDLVNCSTSGVQSFVQSSNASHTWLADLRLPWSLVSNISGPGEEPSFGPVSPVWRINLFRVLMLDDVDFCTPSTCVYGALSPTFANPPAFHIPTYFAVMVLE